MKAGCRTLVPLSVALDLHGLQALAACTLALLPMLLVEEHGVGQEVEVTCKLAQEDRRRTTSSLSDSA